MRGAAHRRNAANPAISETQRRAVWQGRRGPLDLSGRGADVRAAGSTDAPPSRRAVRPRPRHSRPSHEGDQFDDERSDENCRAPGHDEAGPSRAALGCGGGSGALPGRRLDAGRGEPVNARDGERHGERVDDVGFDELGRDDPERHDLPGGQRWQRRHDGGAGASSRAHGRRSRCERGARRPCCPGRCHGGARERHRHRGDGEIDDHLLRPVLGLPARGVDRRGAGRPGVPSGDRASGRRKGCPAQLHRRGRAPGGPCGLRAARHVRRGGAVRPGRAPARPVAAGSPNPGGHRRPAARGAARSPCGGHRRRVLIRDRRLPHLRVPPRTDAREVHAYSSGPHRSATDPLQPRRRARRCLGAREALQPRRERAAERRPAGLVRAGGCRGGEHRARTRQWLGEHAAGRRRRHAHRHPAERPRRRHRGCGDRHDDLSSGQHRPVGMSGRCCPRPVPERLRRGPAARQDHREHRLRGARWAQRRPSDPGHHSRRRGCDPEPLRVHRPRRRLRPRPRRLRPRPRRLRPCPSGQAGPGHHRGARRHCATATRRRHRRDGGRHGHREPGHPRVRRRAGGRRRDPQLDRPRLGPGNGEPRPGHLQPQRLHEPSRRGRHPRARLSLGVAQRGVRP